VACEYSFVFRRQNDNRRKDERGGQYQLQAMVHGTTTTNNGVGIVIKRSLMDGVVDIKQEGDVVILVKLLIEDLVLNVISDYTSQIGLHESVKRHLWE
jgi:hypothetical protein